MISEHSVLAYGIIVGLIQKEGSCLRIDNFQSGCFFGGKLCICFLMESTHRAYCLAFSNGKKCGLEFWVHALMHYVSVRLTVIM